jgi:DNA-binding transcriptional MerR regulator
MVLAEFTTEEAAKLARTTVDNLDNWHRTGFLRAIQPPRRGISRRYTFRDVIALRVTADLRGRGVSMQMLRKIVAYLRAREGPSTTEVLARTNLVTDGERVYEVAGDVTIHIPSGQRTMVYVAVPLDRVVEEVQRGARRLHRHAA